MVSTDREEPIANLSVGSTEGSAPGPSGGTEGSAPGLTPEGVGPPLAEAVPPCGEGIVGLESCSGLTWSPAPQIQANVLLVLEKSFSMAGAPSSWGAAKWDVLKSALHEALTVAPDRFSFGLELFPTSATDTPIAYECAARCCEMPVHAEMNVPVLAAAQSVPEILSTLDGTGPAGASPTARALERAYDYFTLGARGELGGGRYVLLVSDGGPNCNQDLDCEKETCTLNIERTGGCSLDTEFNCCYAQPEACLDELDTQASIEELQQVGVSTIVVGLPGSEQYSEQFAGFALAGGAPDLEGDKAYYEVAAEDGPEALTATLSGIIESLDWPCEIPLAYWQIDDLNTVNVVIDCEVLPKTAPDGSNWAFIFHAHGWVAGIQITGPACERIQQGLTERIDVVVCSGSCCL